MSASLHRLDVEPPLAKPVRAVSAAIDILRCLGRHAESLRLADLAAEIGLNTSTALYILRTLEAEGLVSFDRRGKRYALAEGLADLAAPVLAQHDPARRIARALDTAAEALGATVALWRRDGDQVELIQFGETSAPMRVSFTVGRRLPLFVGAMGRLAAGRDDWTPAEHRAQFDRIRWGRPLTYEAWLTEVAQSRERGWALDDGMTNPGIFAVAVRVGETDSFVAATLLESDTAPDIEGFVTRLQAVAEVCRGIG